MRKHFLKMINTILLIMLFSVLLTACGNDTTAYYLTEKNNLYSSEKTIHEYREKEYAAVGEKDGNVVSIFFEEEKPYCFVCQEDENGKKIYQIIDPADTNEEKTGSKYSASLRHLQADEEAFCSDNPLSFEAQCPEPDKLYLIGKDENGYVKKIYCLFPKSTEYSVINMLDKLRKQNVLDLYFTKNNTCFIRTTAHIYIYNLIFHVFQWSCYTYYYEDICHFVPATDYAYYLSKGKIYYIDLNSFDGYMTHVRNDRLSDINSPACVDDTNRIYIATNNGIMSYSPTGTLWELLISATGKEGFQVENYTPLCLFKTSNETFYLAVKEKESGQVKIYAYSYD